MNTGRRDRAIGWVSVVLSIVYLTPFVNRGWVPQDEGLLGTQAERVLQGQIPHLDFEDAYTGGLSWIYALVFRAFGVELAHLRWVFFLVAAMTLVLLFIVARRFTPPPVAGLATALAALWSFPNYFAAMPSWWLLMCALLVIWFVIRSIESANIAWIFSAGLAAGLSVAIKQTGIYLIVALFMTVVFNSAPLLRPLANRLLRVVVAVTAVSFAVVVTGRGLALGEMVFLILPVAACSAGLAVSSGCKGGPPFTRSVLAVLFGAAIIPTLLLTPYLRTGRVWEFVDGILVRPQARLAFASSPMPPAVLIVLGVPVLAILSFAPADRVRLVVSTSLVAVAGALLVISGLYAPISYQLLWHATRASVSLIPLALIWRYRHASGNDATQAFLASAVLAWIALNQFPFAAPIYFCYVAPLGVLAALALIRTPDTWPSPPVMVWGALLAVFAASSMNSGDIHSLGGYRLAVTNDTPLDLPRAHLSVEQQSAVMYRELVAVIERHIGGGRLVALPDAPDVYFLTGQQSRGGRMYDFLDGSDRAGNEAAERDDWQNASVVVMAHRERDTFSKPLSEATQLKIRRAFDMSERVGHFEVRWRSINGLAR